MTPSRRAPLTAAAAANGAGSSAASARLAAALSSPSGSVPVHAASGAVKMPMLRQTPERKKSQAAAKPIPAGRIFYKERGSKSTLHFDPFTAAEMRQFWGARLRMAIVQRPTMREYWTKYDGDWGTCLIIVNFTLSAAIKASGLTRTRFEQIQRFISGVEDKTKRPEEHDAFWRVRPLIESLQTIFEVIFGPGQAVVGSVFW